MNTRNGELLGNYNVRKLLVQLSIPAMIGMGVNALYNLVDTIFVAQGAGEIAIGALAFAFPVQLILYAIGLMIGIGGASVFSRAYGAGDKLRMKLTINTAIRIDIVLALIVSVFVYLNLDEMLMFFRASESNIGYAKDYLSIILLGLVPLTLSMVFNNFARAEGRANIAMIGMVIGAGMNIILDPIFIYDWGFGLGVKGAAIATVISQFMGFSFMLYMSFRPESVLEINIVNVFYSDIKVLWDIIIIGFPTFIRNAIGAVLSIIIFVLIDNNVTGDPAIYISIYGVINRLIAFLFMPAFGVVQGLSPIVGFNYGARKFSRLREAILDATIFLLVYFTVAFIIIQLGAPLLFRIFSKESTGFFIDYGSKALRLMSMGFILITFQVLMGSVYQALGYAFRAFFVSLSRQFLFFIPIVYFMTEVYGIDGIWYTFIIADMTAGLLSLSLFFIEMKILSKKVKIEKSLSVNG